MERYTSRSLIARPHSSFLTLFIVPRSRVLFLFEYPLFPSTVFLLAFPIPSALFHCSSAAASQNSKQHAPPCRPRRRTRQESVEGKPPQHGLTRSRALLRSSSLTVGCWPKRSFSLSLSRSSAPPLSHPRIYLRPTPRTASCASKKLSQSQRALKKRSSPAHELSASPLASCHQQQLKAL